MEGAPSWQVKQQAEQDRNYKPLSRLSLRKIEEFRVFSSY
jgi:hypothetical protein